MAHPSSIVVAKVALRLGAKIADVKGGDTVSSRFLRLTGLRIIPRAPRRRSVRGHHICFRMSGRLEHDARKVGTGFSENIMLKQ
jgi:hypothetical protein